MTNLLMFIQEPKSYNKLHKIKQLLKYYIKNNTPLTPNDIDNLYNLSRQIDSTLIIEWEFLHDPNIDFWKKNYNKPVAIPLKYTIK